MALVKTRFLYGSGFHVFIRNRSIAMHAAVGWAIKHSYRWTTLSLFLNRQIFYQ